MAGTEPAPPDTQGVESIPSALMQLSIDTRKSARSSEPTTPGDSPISLDSALRDWLSETLKETSNNPKVYVKLLVSNGAAGSIIGKGGTNINDCQMKTFARIQLSKSQEYFPGTQERTLLISGRLKNVVAALSMLLDKLVRENVAPLSPRTRSGARPPSPEPRLQLKVLVPQALCGIIIGKMGSTIRGFAADTGTNIRVVQDDQLAVPLANRIVTVAGHVPGILRAIALLVLKQSEDTTYSMFSDLSSTYATSPASVLPGMPYMAGYGVGFAGPGYAATMPPHRLGGWAGSAAAAGIGPTLAYAHPHQVISPAESVTSAAGADSAVSGPGSTMRTPEGSSVSFGTAAAPPAATTSGPSSGSIPGPGKGSATPNSGHPAMQPGAAPRTQLQVLVHRDQAAMLSDGGYALANHLGRISGARLRLEPGPQQLPGLGPKGRLLTLSGPQHAVHHVLALLTTHVGQLLPVGPAGGWVPSAPAPPLAGVGGGATAAPTGTTAPYSTTPQPTYYYNSQPLAPQHQPYMPIATTIAGCTYYSLPPTPGAGPAYAHQPWQQHRPRMGSSSDAGSDNTPSVAAAAARSSPMDPAAPAAPAGDECTDAAATGSGSQVATPCSGASSTVGVDDEAEPGHGAPQHVGPPGPQAIAAAT